METKKEKKRWYFNGDQGCNYCNAKSGFVDHPDYTAHMNCVCPTSPVKEEAEPIGPQDYEVVYHNKEINVAASRIEEIERADMICNNEAQTILVEMSIDASFNGNYSVDAGVEAAFGDALTGFNLEDSISSSMMVYIKKNSHAHLRAKCILQVDEYKVDVLWKYPNGEEIPISTDYGQIIHIVKLWVSTIYSD